jgi:hypothetical protein
VDTGKAKVLTKSIKSGFNAPLNAIISCKSGDADLPGRCAARPSIGLLDLLRGLAVQHPTRNR